MPRQGDSCLVTVWDEGYLFAGKAKADQGLREEGGKATESLAIYRAASSLKIGHIKSFNGKMGEVLLNGDIVYPMKECGNLIEMWRKECNNI